jgi:hypothetical protein
MQGVSKSLEKSRTRCQSESETYSPLSIMSHRLLENTFQNYKDMRRQRQLGAAKNTG